MLIKLILNILI